MSAISRRCRRVSRLSGACDPQSRRRTRDGADALGHAASAAHRWSARHQHPEYIVTALAHMAQAGEPLSRAVQQLRRICAGAEPRDKEERRGGSLTMISARYRPLPGHGTKSKPIPGPHDVYGFLTTSPDAIVQSGRRGRATFRSLSGSQTCPASETGLPRLPTHLPDETMCGTGVCVRSHKLFDLKLPAAAALAQDSGHRACRRGLATSPRTRPR